MGPKNRPENRPHPKLIFRYNHACGRKEMTYLSKTNELAKKMGVTREGLYKSLNGNTKPRFETICKALNALGFQITIKTLKSEA